MWADGFADGVEERDVGVDFPSLFRVGDFFVVFSVAAFFVKIYQIFVYFFRKRERERRSDN